MPKASVTVIGRDEKIHQSGVVNLCQEHYSLLLQEMMDGKVGLTSWTVIDCPEDEDCYQCSKG